MKRFLLIILLLICTFAYTFSLVACGNENIRLSNTEIEVAVGNYEGFHFTANEKSKVRVVSTNESIATVSSTQRSSTDKSYVIVTLKGESVGECSITVQVGNVTKFVSVKVGFIPEIKLYQTYEYGFHIETNFPAGTIVVLTLKGNNYLSSQKGTLEKKSWYYSYQNFTVESVTNGTYSLSVELDDFANQPQQTKNELGDNGEFVLGKYMQEKDNIKMFEAMFTIELPYISMEKKIAATAYKSLTREQKLYIKKWIDNRYDYYDKKEGKDTGNKYTSTIFNEAAELFNKTYNEIKQIWGDPNISLYD